MGRFVAEVTEGQKAKLARIAKGLRQVDVASKARVTVTDVVYLEKGRFLRPTIKEKIIAVLGITNDKGKRSQ